MDSAAEAGRRATNGILDAAGSTAQRATIPTANELWFLKPAKALDELAYRFKRRPADRRPDRSEV